MATQVAVFLFIIVAIVSELVSVPPHTPPNRFPVLVNPDITVVLPPDAENQKLLKTIYGGSAKH